MIIRDIWLHSALNTCMERPFKERLFEQCHNQVLRVCKNQCISFWNSYQHLDRLCHLYQQQIKSIVRVDLNQTVSIQWTASERERHTCRSYVTQYSLQISQLYRSRRGYFTTCFSTHARPNQISSPAEKLNFKDFTQDYEVKKEINFASLMLFEKIIQYFMASILKLLFSHQN